MILLRLLFVLVVFIEIHARYTNSKYYKDRDKDRFADYNCCVDYCYTEDDQPYKQFSTKTGYQPALEQSINIPGCTPVQFWHINRHGTRYPSDKDTLKLAQLKINQEEIIKNYDNHLYPDQGALCISDFEALRNWEWDTDAEGNGNELTKQGKTELTYTARSFANKYRELLGQSYNKDIFYFRHTDKHRTRDSFKAYAKGLFGDDISDVKADVHEEDLLLKATDFCDAWINDVDGNPETKREYENFLARTDYQQMVSDVSIRLGYDTTLNESVIDNMYDMCRYERAWKPEEISPWCAVFNKDQLKMLEYAEDLKYYYSDGYGNEINVKVGCPPVKDLYERFESRVNGDKSGAPVVVYFTHSDTVQPFIAAMGIAKDDAPLTAENYEQQDQRQWRTSFIGSFASNLAAALYECETGEKYRVAFYLNEVPVNYPDCTNGVCDWSVVKTLLEDTARNCSLDFCNQS